MSSFSRTTHHIADQFKDSASSARSSLADFGAHAMKMLDSARDRESDAVEFALDRLGLQRRQSPVVPALYFLAGALVAGAAAALLTPTTGKRLRAQILDLLNAAPHELEKRVDAALSTETPAMKIPSTGATATEKPITSAIDRSPRIVPTHQS